MDASHSRTADPEFVRALGGCERGIDMMEVHQGTGHIVRVVTFEGSLDPTLFEQAVRNIVQRRPILRTRVVRPPEEMPYFARSDEWPPVTVVERRDADQWRQEFGHHLSTPLSAAGVDTLLRLTALVGDACGEIVLSCHHAVVDGRSLTAFCRDLVHEYEWLLRGAPGDPVTVHGDVGPPLEAILPPALTSSGGAEFLAAFGGRLRDLMSSPPGLILELPEVPDEPPGRHLLTHELPLAAAQALSAAARANGATIGGAMSAAVLRAGLDVGAREGENTLGLSSNIDLRPHLQENVPLVNMGSYASSSFNAYSDVPTKSFWTLAREVTQTVKSSIESLDAYGSAMLSEHVFPEYEKHHAVMKNWPQFMLANLGRMNLPEPHEAFRVRTIHGGSPLYGILPFFFCSAVGLEKSLAIDVNYQTPTTPHQLARDFTEALVDRLLTETGTAAASSA